MYSQLFEFRLEEKFRAIFKATLQHARKLAFFVTIYKTLMVAQHYVKGKEHQVDSFLAGLVGGYYVFGNDNSVNQQVPIVNQLIQTTTHSNLRLCFICCQE